VRCVYADPVFSGVVCLGQVTCGRRGTRCLGFGCRSYHLSGPESPTRETSRRPVHMDGCSSGAGSWRQTELALKSVLTTRSIAALASGIHSIHRAGIAWNGAAWAPGRATWLTISCRSNWETRIRHQFAAAVGADPLSQAGISPRAIDAPTKWGERAVHCAFDDQMLRRTKTPGAALWMNLE